MLMSGPVLHFEGEECPVCDGVPSIGEHTDEVLTELLSLSGAECAGRGGTVRHVRAGRRPR